MMMYRALLFISLMLPTLCFAEMKFIPVYHQSPQSIVEKIKPFLGEGDVAIAGHNEIILRTNSNKADDLLTLIKKLDKAAHRLMVLVNRDGQFNLDKRGYQAEIINKITTHSKPSLSGHAKIYSTQDATKDNSTDKIMVLDGYPAFIETGVNEPTPVIQLHQYGEHSHITGSTQYRRASKGFYVTPRLSKNSVILEIAPWKEDPLSKNPTSAAYSRVSTVVRGKLDTWIALAGVNESDTNSTSNVLGKHYTTTSKSNTIWVKVIDLDANLN